MDENPRQETELYMPIAQQNAAVNEGKRTVTQKKQRKTRRIHKKTDFDG